LDAQTDPSGSVTPFDGWSSISTSNLLGGQGIPGTGPGDAMPWSGETFTYQPWVPVENFINSLMATPSTTGLDGTGIDAIYGNPTEIMQTFQAFLAGLAFFDPFTPGSPFCPGECTAVTTAGLDYPDLIKDINNMTPGGNPVINEWLTNYANGTANVPTAEQIQNSIALLQNHNFWDFANPSYLGNNTPGSFDLATLAPEFHQFWTDLGFTVPPLAASSEAASTAAAGVDPSTLSTDLGTLTAMFSTASVSDLLSTLTADLTTQLQADLSTMLASVAADVPANLATTLPADLLTMF
jgi:hypothetical protein